MLAKLQYISQGNTADVQLTNIKAALEAGCRWIQLRFKNANEEELNETAQEVKKLCSAFNAILIINDHPQIAKAVDADGVHLGLQDTGIDEARKIIGKEKIIGGTANTLDDVLQRYNEGCSYVGVGPYRFTTTKEKLSPILGLQGYADIMNELSKRNIHIPVYAIGGIVLEDIADLVSIGVYGIAASGIITHHHNKKIFVQQINSLLYEASHHS
ncbi:MAG: thiamine phosphate synthase [Sediminibacterium sp.]|jgi:thiamine-phosphate pyrophosphorylase|nr:thiamine phosphate synthase [Chitinophagaceae bacterium]MCA6446271.1 thiamine phosphate synthase [Chitinophagaceae bacterium]